MRKPVDNVKKQIILSELRYLYDMRNPVRTGYKKKCQRYKLEHAFEDLTKTMLKFSFNEADVNYIITELKKSHRKKYGEKMRKDGMGYEPVRNSYDLEDFINDVEFEFNHFHL